MRWRRSAKRRGWTCWPKSPGAIRPSSWRSASRPWRCWTSTSASAARTRLQAGASPESVLLTAQVALARAELAHARTVQQAVAARQHLAALWGERAPSAEPVSGNPLALPTLASL